MSFKIVSSSTELLNIIRATSSLNNLTLKKVRIPRFCFFAQNVNDKKENVLPAMMFDISRHAVKTPAMIAYSSLLVMSSNMIITIF